MSILFIGRMTFLVFFLNTIFFYPQNVHAGINVYIEPSQALIRQVVRVNAGSFVHWNFSLVQGTKLVAEFQVAGGFNNEINVWLLDLDNFQKYINRQTFSYFNGTAGTVQRGGKYEFEIPQTNAYYMILDNTRALMFSRDVKLNAYVVFSQPTKWSVQTEKIYEAFYQELKKIFIFDDFKIFLRHCGFANAFSSPDITICVELMESFAAQGIGEALGFILFHELSHTLLRLWDYPLWDNEDAADEFSSVFMVMTKKESMALAAAKWFASNTSVEQAKAALWTDDRHTLSPQRARNIIRWINNSPELLRRWQKIFVPNMQTTALQELARQNDRWVDHQIIREELAKRQVLGK